MKINIKASLMCNQTDNFSIDRYIHVTTHRLATTRIAIALQLPEVLRIVQ